MRKNHSLSIYKLLKDRSSSTRLTKVELLFIFCLSLTTFVVFYFVYSRYILTNAHWDTGWIKQVIWQNVLQKMPYDCCLSGTYSSEYISWEWHFTPLFSLVSLLSYLWPFTANSWLIAFFAVQPTLLFLFTCLIYFSKKVTLFNSNYSNYLVPVLLSTSLGSMRALAFPHYELLYLVFLLAIFYFISRNQKSIVVIFVILILSIKEDSAFYLVILIWAICYGLVRFRKILAASIILLAPSLIYLTYLSFARDSVQISSNFAGMTNLQAHYVGKPFFSHITIDFLASRLTDILQTNFYILFLQFILTVLAIRYREYFILRLMISTIPLWTASLLAVSWVKGQMLTYEIIPIWASIMISILFFPWNKFENSILVKVSSYLIIVVLIFGLVNASSKFLIKTTFMTTPNEQSMTIIDDIIQQAKSDGIKLDTNFFVYNPHLVSHDSWLYDLNNFKSGSCFLHLPDSDRKLTLERTNDDLEFETFKYMDSSFLKTCAYLK